MSNQQKSKKLKRQRSILEFAEGVSSSKFVSSFRSHEVIDLTIDDIDEVPYKGSIKSEIKAEEQTVGVNKEEVILCPICELSLNNLSLESRIGHVDTCLKQEGKKPDIDEKSEHGPMESTQGNSSKPQLRKDIEKVKYSNLLNRPKGTTNPSKPPKSIRKTANKNPIPKEKILHFKISNRDRYRVAVDAFNYAINDTIEMYFLSHFHSDHYGGISKNWCYSRTYLDGDDLGDQTKAQKIIYCSNVTAKLLNVKFGIEFKFINVLELNVRYQLKDYYTDRSEDVKVVAYSMDPGLYVTLYSANHCPGSVLFLFESIDSENKVKRILHCGDFRVSKEMFSDDVFGRFLVSSDGPIIDQVYLDTTYFHPSHNFPKQEDVCNKTISFFQSMLGLTPIQNSSSRYMDYFSTLKQTRITDYLGASVGREPKKEFLILVGTYLIGKEKLALALSKGLGNCPIYVSSISSRQDKNIIISCFDDKIMNDLITENDRGDSSCTCMIHLVPMRIVNSQEEITKYFQHNMYYNNFKKCIGIRPTGWSFNEYGPSSNTFTDFFHGDSTEEELGILLSNIATCLEVSPQIEAFEQLFPPPKTSIKSNLLKRKKMDNPCQIYSVPYSEHSSFRELLFFIIFLKAKEIIPTVNISSEKSRDTMNKMINLLTVFKEFKLNNSSDKLRTLHASLRKRIEAISIEDF